MHVEPYAMKTFLLTGLLLIEAVFGKAQFEFPQQKINAGLKNAAVHSAVIPPNCCSVQDKLPGSPAHFFQQFPYDKPVSLNISNVHSRNIDTVVVGAVPHDTLTISGTYFNDGPIFVVNDGVLIFENSQATINGDLAVTNSAKVFATNSSLYFPQQYFYQRNLIAVNDAKVQFTNTSLNYSGLSHNLAIIDSASVQYQNVNVIGFTTTGLYGQPSFVIDTCNLVGEIILTDEATVNISKGDTVLLWHQFPEGSVIHRSFPDGADVAQYDFNSTSTGVSGISYSVSVTNCTNVMWGLMPVNGSYVTIDSSNLRAIGAWFLHSDVANVSGLVDGSYYENSSNLFSDRNLQLNQTSVTTWSIYPMDTSTITMSNCILGEIGTEQHSTLSAQDIFVDGSGGYFWATDQSFLVAALSAFTCTVRSEGTGIIVVAYSGITNGTPEATSNSILILVQDGFTQSPQLYDGSEVWVMNLDNPASAVVNSSIEINGSAYIHRTAISLLPTFDHYQLFYQSVGSTTWIPVSAEENISVDDGLLATWNTYGISPGLYNLNLVMKDNFGDSVVATNTINLLPNFTGVQQNDSGSSIEFYPDPASDEVYISGLQNKFTSCKIVNDRGETMREISLQKNENQILMSVADLPSGLYTMIFSGNSRPVSKAFIIQR